MRRRLTEGGRRCEVGVARWSIGLAGDGYRIDVSLVEIGGLLCLLAVVVAVIAAGVFIGVRLAQRRR